LRLEPQFFPAMLALGKLHLDQGNNSDALQVLTDAVRRNPNDSQAHFQLSQAMHRAGDKQGADREIQQMQEIQALEREFSSLHAAAAKEPNDAALRFRAGEVARQLGKLKLARLWYRAALAIDPSDIKSRSALHELDRST
jgi:Flp pilus assembly protein TadD